MTAPEVHLRLLDLSNYLSGTSTTEETAKLAGELRGAYETTGFCYLTGWDSLVPASLVADVFKYNELLFSLPTEKKDALAYTTPEANRGYLAFGRESAATDKKETFEIGNDLVPEYPERWPSEEDLPGFRETMKQMHELAHALNVRLMSLLAMSIGLDPEFFTPLIAGRHNNLRLLHYPPTPKEEGAMRLKAHTDDGTLTLLWQDFTGGLQIRDNTTGIWHDVVPIEGTVLVNVADVLTRWSNDVLKSTWHRALLPISDVSDGELVKARRSVAFFCNPNPDTIIKCIDGLGGEPKYKPVLAKDFYASKLGGNIRADY